MGAAVLATFAFRVVCRHALVLLVHSRGNYISAVLNLPGTIGKVSVAARGEIVLQKSVGQRSSRCAYFPIVSPPQESAFRFPCLLRQGLEQWGARCFRKCLWHVW